MEYANSHQAAKDYDDCRKFIQYISVTYLKQGKSIIQDRCHIEDFYHHVTKFIGSKADDTIGGKTIYGKCIYLYGLEMNFKFQFIVTPAVDSIKYHVYVYISNGLSVLDDFKFYH